MANIGFIGAGKVGTTLAKRFVYQGLSLTGFFSRSFASAVFASKVTLSKAYEDLKDLVEDSDILFLTVPDDCLKETVEKLTHLPISGKKLVHTSGVYSVDDIFPNREDFQVQAVGLHPLFPNSDKEKVWETIHKATFTLEGDKGLVALFSELLDSWHFTYKVISPSLKSKYHAAASISSNLYCALVDESLSLMQQCGFDEKEALMALKPLMMANLENILEKGPKLALTGPIERNDICTVKRHLQAMKTDFERHYYAQSALAVVSLAQKKHPQNNYSLMQQILKDI